MSMFKSKKILEDIHPLNVIKEVQKWPVLYQKDNPERLNFHFKTKVWYEVAKNLIPNWEQLSDIEKDVKVSELTKKWRNLRDTFRRRVEAERRARAGGAAGAGGGPRRRYVYFKHMLFLLPHVTAPEDEPDLPRPDLPRPDRLAERRDTRKRKRKRNTLVQDSSIGESKTEYIDEDKHFLMSLIPSFQKMSDHEKLTAKVEILKVIQLVRSGSTSIEFTTPDIEYVEECGAEGEGGAGGEGVTMQLLPEGDDLDSDDSGSLEST